MDTQIITTITVLMMAMPVSFAGNAPTPVSSQTALEQDGFIPHSAKNLDGDEKLAWIADMRTKLPITSREIGPFGMAQDPDAAVVKPQQLKRKTGAFLNAIAAIKVNAVMPSDRKFVIGAREVEVGDAFPVISGQRQFNIKIIAVKSDYITFKNVDTDEYVKRNLNTLPQGITRNTRIDSVPGVVAASKKDITPLNLDQIEVHTLQQH
mgnify:CR=1 FL=1